MSTKTRPRRPRRPLTIKTAHRALAAAEKNEAVAKNVLKKAVAEHVAMKARVRDGARVAPNALQLTEMRMHLATIKLGEARVAVVRAEGDVMLAMLRA